MPMRQFGAAWIERVLGRDGNPAMRGPAGEHDAREMEAYETAILRELGFDDPYQA